MDGQKERRRNNMKEKGEDGGRTERERRRRVRAGDRGKDRRDLKGGDRKRERELPGQALLMKRQNADQSVLVQF